MPETPSDLAARKIRTLCRELSGRKGLSDEVREELCGHLEDKLAGYLRGDVKVTEDDALLLVQAHFGDYATIASQLERDALANRPITIRHRLIKRAAIATAVLTTTAFLAAALNSSGAFWNSAFSDLYVALVAAVVALFVLPMVCAVRLNPQLRAERLVAVLMIVLVAAMYFPLLGGRSMGIFTLPGPSVPIAFRAAWDTICAAAFAGQAALVVLLLVPVRTDSQTNVRDSSRGDLKSI